jgi:uncharacterized protein
VSEILRWAKGRDDILSLSLVGSWARCQAREDSDVDLIVLVLDPKRFKLETWISEINWRACGANILRWEDKEYGVVWSRHIFLEPAMEVELTFATVSWASIDPIDSGTRQSVQRGCRILHDPHRLMSRLLAAL